MNNEEKILSLLEKLSNDMVVVKSDVSVLKFDVALQKHRFDDIIAEQEKQALSLARLEEGQNALEEGQIALEEGQNALKVGQIALEEGQNALKEGQARLEKRQDTLETKLDFVSGAVVRIENEHGKQLTALFDGYHQLNEIVDRTLRHVSVQDDKILKRVFPQALEG